MLNPGIVYMLASVVLFAVAVVVHFHALNLSLPISPVITVLAVVLPIAAFVNAYIYPNLLRSSHACSEPSAAHHSALKRLAPVILQGFQAILTACLATLLSEGVVPSPVLDFLLEYEWGNMYEARDAESLRLIQDTYKCCGLKAVTDRAYPFSGPACAELYGRAASCMPSWRVAMQVSSALDFSVVVAVGLMQMVGLLMMRERTKWWTALRTQDWKRPYSDDTASQSLLGPDQDEEAAGPSDTEPQAYGAVQDREPMPTGEPEAQSNNASGSH